MQYNIYREQVELSARMSPKNLAESIPQVASREVIKASCGGEDKQYNNINSIKH